MKKLKVIGIIVMAAVIMAGCKSIGKVNAGAFPNIDVPAKDFTSLGIVYTENVVENYKGKVYTYYELVRKAKELGADAIVNVTMDVQLEGTKFLCFYLYKKETWYGSATAIKYSTGVLKDVTTNNTESTSVTKEGVIMSGGGGSGGGDSGGSSPGSSDSEGGIFSTIRNMLPF